MKNKVLSFIAVVQALGVIVSAQTITSQPQSVTAPLGGVAVFSVGVSGTGPFTYQWEFDGANLPQDIIATIAGNGAGGYGGDGGPAIAASLYQPGAVAVDASGDVFIADTDNGRIREVATNGVITTVAGNGYNGYAGDLSLATNASLNYPSGVAVDAYGNLFIADTDNQRVRKVDTNGIITTVAGNGTNGYAGDSGLATNASLFSPASVAVDGLGNLFIADMDNQRVRKVDTHGIITTVAGNGDYGFSGDGVPATNASVWAPSAVAVDGAGNLFIADEGNQRIRKVGTNGVISTVAGSGASGYSGDGGAATTAGLDFPDGLAVDAYGDIFIADSYSDRIRQVTPNGIIGTLAGNGTASDSGDGGAASAASLDGPAGLALDGAGNLYIADSLGNCVRQINLSGTLTLNNLSLSSAGSYQVIVTSPAGSVTSRVATLTVMAAPVISIEPASQNVAVGGNALFSVTADGAPPLSYAWYLGKAAIGGATNSSYRTDDVQLADSGSQFSCVITNLYGSVTSSAATLTVALPPVVTAGPTNQTVVEGGNVTFAVGLSGLGPFNYQWMFDGTNPVEFITTFAGDGGEGYSGDGVEATNSTLYYPTAVAVDASGNVFIADTHNERIRKVDTNGIITTVAGDGSGGYTGDGVEATNTSLYYPDGIAVDAVGNLFIADQYNYRVRKVDLNGIMTTVAGNGDYGYSGDGGPATNASLRYVWGVAVDAAGNFFIADGYNQCIRKVGTDGIITTVAGTGNAGYSGDGGPATSADLYYPAAVAVDALGNLFIADMDNERVRKVDTNGIITTVAGNGDYDYSGDGGPATNASFRSLEDVAVDAVGRLFIADTYNNRVREVDLNGIITTVAGNGIYAFSGDGGLPTNASLAYPEGVAVDAFGNLLIADKYNSRIREVSSPAILTLTNLSANNAGSYEVIVTSPFGSVTSAVATLSVLLPPAITVQPVSQSIVAGSNVTFSVTAAGTAPLSYEWYRGGMVIAGATNSSYSTNDVQMADSGSRFACVITNAYGAVTSSVATLTVGAPPVISAQPTNQMTLVGQSVAFGLTVSGTGPFSYQWQLNGTNVADNVITTLAGDGGAGYSGDGVAATNLELYEPVAVAVDGAGDVFIADTYNERIRKVDSNGVMTTVAGNGQSGYAGDGGEAILTARLYDPDGVAVDGAGNVYIGDEDNSRIRKVNTNGIITTVAGDGGYGYSGDGNAATNESLYYPQGVAVDAAGNLFIADSYNQRIRKVDTNGIITTVAGNGGYGYAGDGGPATNANFRYPDGVAVDGFGNVFITEEDNDRVRKVDTNGIIWTVAGNGTYGYAGDGGPATNAQLYYPLGVAVDAAGNLFIADEDNYRIRKVDLNGIITTVAGNGDYGFSGDGSPATNASFRYPSGVAVDASGNLFIADTYNERIRKVAPTGAGSVLSLKNLTTNSAGNYQVIVTTPFGSVTSAVATLTFLFPPSITVQPASQDIIAGSNVSFGVTVAGTEPFAYAWYRGGAAIARATDSTYTTNDVQLADSGSQFVCVITNAYGSVTSSAATLTVGLPLAIAAQPTNQTALEGGSAAFGLKLSGTGPFAYQWQLNGTNLPYGLIHTVAGDGVASYAGDGGPATNASLYYPEGVVVDALGNVFIADTDNEVIRKVDTNGMISTLAGTGYYGYSGDGGAATNASLRHPEDVAVDAFGNVFIADEDNSRIRKVAVNGIITTVAGNGDFSYSGDGGPATNASLYYPDGVAVDASGNLFIADYYNQRVRKVGLNGIITTVAGNGNYGYSGDGGPATNASLYYPDSVAVDASGFVFISDESDVRVRKVDTNGIITTVAGNGNYSYSGDGGPATNATFRVLESVAVDGLGDLFIADGENSDIREVNFRGIITTVAGNGGFGFYGDGGAAIDASLDYPEGVAVDASGDVFIADTGNHRIREVVPLGAAPMLSLRNISANEAGSYRVIVATPFGSVTSAVVTLTVLSPPSVVVQPVSQHAIAGGDVTFEVGVTGTPPFGYTWHRDSTAIAGATASAYTLNDVPLADSGSQFTCVITNAYGSVTSDIALLMVGVPPAITAQPSNQTAQAGNNVALGLTLSGTGPFQYQWLFNGTNLPGGLIYTVAGNGNYGFSGDGGAATNASLEDPVSVAVDAFGDVYIVDDANDRVRKVDTNGIIWTVAGVGISDYWGDGGPATNAALSDPWGVAVDAAGNVFIADERNDRIRKVGTNGIITTVAGNGTAGYAGDGGAATNANLDSPTGLVVDEAGDLIFADTGNSVVRKVATNGIITTVAGNGDYGFFGDGGPATNAVLAAPVGVALDATGNLFIADADDELIRKVDTNGIITTVAGNEEYGFSGDGGAATNATFEDPDGVAVDAAGDLFIVDNDDARIREVDAFGIITTVAGSGAEAYSDSDGVAATGASLDDPNGVALDSAGDFYIADSENSLVRKVVPFGAAPTLALTNVAANNAGSYQVIVTSLYGSVTSSVATVSVLSGSLISSIHRNANGSVTLSLQTAPNASSRVQATTNLARPADWLPIYTNGNAGSSGQWQFTDTNAANYRERFYRAATP